MDKVIANRLEHLRDHASDSIGVAQMTLSLLSIFLGFVFAALLYVLATSGVNAPPAVVCILAASLMVLMTAFLGFVVTAHQVMYFWAFFMPESWSRIIASITTSVGLFLVQLVVAVLLIGRGFKRTGWITVMHGAILVIFAGVMFYRMKKNNKCTAWVGEGAVNYTFPSMRQAEDGTAKSAVGKP